jgi:hypothetical protein
MTVGARCSGGCRTHRRHRFRSSRKRLAHRFVEASQARLVYFRSLFSCSFRCFAHRAFCASLILFRASVDITRRFEDAAALSVRFPTAIACDLSSGNPL